MRARLISVFMAAVLGGAAGCAGPRLASRPLTEEQLEWTSFIRASYPGWQPPNYTTVVNQDPNLAPVEPAPAFPASPLLAPVPAASPDQIDSAPAESSR